MIAHLDEQVNPEISLLDGLLVGRQVTVDNEEVCVGSDCVLDEPCKTLGRVGEVAVLFQVNIACLGDSLGHMELLYFQDIGRLLSDETYPCVANEVPAYGPHLPLSPD